MWLWDLSDHYPVLGNFEFEYTEPPVVCKSGSCKDREGWAEEEVSGRGDKRNNARDVIGGREKMERKGEDGRGWERKGEEGRGRERMGGEGRRGHKEEVDQFNQIQDGCKNDDDCHFSWGYCYCTGPGCTLNGTVVNGKNYGPNAPINADCKFLAWNGQCRCHY
jgi:hypothetical protein